LAPSGYSLKFLSGKYQGGEFALPDGREIVVGRASDLDMVLMEDMVSRQHARILSAGGAVTVEDLGSTNGTFVNGQRIERTQLRTGDRVLIGTSIVRLIDRTESAHSMMSTLEQAQSEQAPAAAQREHALSGRLEDISLPDLLQLLSASRKNGVLVLRSKARRGTLVMEEGRIVECHIAGVEGLDPHKAFYRVLGWSEGQFALEGPSGAPVEVVLKEPTEALLMEGVRQLDELKHLEPDLPAPDAVLMLDLPILAPLRSLTPELLDTLQLAHNLGRLQEVLDQSAASDLDTCEELLYLLHHGYLKVA